MLVDFYLTAFPGENVIVATKLLRTSQCSMYIHFTTKCKIFYAEKLVSIFRLLYNSQEF
jgi:hypothetical protein